jgi:signal peptidase
MAAATPRRWRKALDVSETLTAVLIAVVGALSLVVALATHFSKYGEYTVFGHPVMVVLSGSMAPKINTGDLIVDKQATTANVAQLHRGQVITFRDVGGKVLTHRIYAVQSASDGSTTYITKGDANNAPDTSAVAPSSVIGIYEHRVPYGGYALNSLHRPLVAGLLIASPILWLIAAPLKAYARREDEEGSSS